ncbi:MAG: hypothetical protein R2911_14375 [Caldilineaceae bacterium]
MPVTLAQMNHRAWPSPLAQSTGVAVCTPPPAPAPPMHPGYPADRPNLYSFFHRHIGAQLHMPCLQPDAIL